MAGKNRYFQCREDSRCHGLIHTDVPFPSLIAKAPIGIFDSGIGGLSVLRHVHTLLPHEDLLYVADSSYAPYGGRTEEEIVARTAAIAEFLLDRGAKALVLACNTATAAAIAGLRKIYPDLPVVGVEPGLKPAAALTQSRVVGVMATVATLGSDKFKQLHEQITAATQVNFVLQACVGLADEVEKGVLDSATLVSLIKFHVTPLIEQGADTVVLGCTHYPFVQALIEACIRQATDRQVAIVDTGEAVARQLVRVLEQNKLRHAGEQAGTLEAFATGSEAALGKAFADLLNLQPEISRITL
jgi:glutamate racemase